MKLGSRRNDRSLMRWLSGMFVGAAVICGGPGSARAATPEQVSAAIKNAVKYLRQSQKGGNWEIVAADNKSLNPTGGPSEAAQYGGRTALGAYALLAAGEKAKDDPELDAAIKWLMKADIKGTYAVGLRAQVWLLSEPFKGRDALIEADRNFLLDSCIQKGEEAGFYGYSYSGPVQASAAPVAGSANNNNSNSNKSTVRRDSRPVKFGDGGPGKDYWYDRSNSQYGVLGLWALQQAGAEIPEKYWEIVDKGWREQQHHDGGWDYRNDSEGGSSPTMTAAGIATLFITEDYLLLGRHWEPCGGGVMNDNIENGMRWIDKHVKELLTTNNFYGMYGVERIGTASGRKYFGTQNWYEVGAEFLVANQKPDGSWTGAYPGQVDTSFGLVFLARGRAPVMLNKLQYENTGKKEKELNGWDERPRDAANLTRWMATREEGYLNWQVVNLKAPQAELHDAPILYMAGHEELKLSVPDETKLRDFVNSGGLILGQADCNSTAFTQSFEKLGEKLFPKYKFRAVPASSAIYQEDFSPKRWRTPVALRGLSNGSRELMLVLPTGDPGRSWQTDSTKTHQEAFELAADIYFYATDQKQLYVKGQTYLVEPDKNPAATKLSIARIMLDATGNWDPEPGGWARLAAVFHNQLKVDLTAEAVTLGQGKLGSYKLAHLTGTGKVDFTAEQQQELRDFVEKGGTLIVDAAGGDATFSETAQTALAMTFKDSDKAMATALPMDAPIYSSIKKLTAVSYRRWATRLSVGNAKVGRIKAIPQGNRLAVFFSGEDLSTGLVGQPVDGVTGYEPASATDLMINMIAYGAGLKPPPPPATAPAPGAAPAAPAPKVPGK